MDMEPIGRFAVGRSAMVGEKRKMVLRRVICKMEAWRDKARRNLFKQRRRYKRKVEKNRDLMKAKKVGKLQNLNPTCNLDELGFKPKAIHRHQLTHSTVPLKPKYSIVKPRERIYGNKWKKLKKEV